MRNDIGVVTRPGPPCEQQPDDSHAAQRDESRAKSETRAAPSSQVVCQRAGERLALSRGVRLGRSPLDRIESVGPDLTVLPTA